MKKLTVQKKLFKKYDEKNRQELTIFFLQMDVLQLGDVFENFLESSTREYYINHLYSYSLPGYTWKTGLKITKIKLDFIKDKEFLLLFENNICGEFQV